MLENFEQRKKEAGADLERVRVTLKLLSTLSHGLRLNERGNTLEVMLNTRFLSRVSTMLFLRPGKQSCREQRKEMWISSWMSWLKDFAVRRRPSQSKIRSVKERNWATE
jgi:hypothetical protein